MYIKYNQQSLTQYLPEKRSNTHFTNPDVFLVFEDQIRFVIWDVILEELTPSWLENKKLWDSDFDFGANVEDYEKQFDDYKTVELLEFPAVEDLDIEESFAFVYSKDGELYISEKFIQDLKLAGCSEVWYNTTAPFSRY